MICYAHITQLQPPVFLRGARDLQHSTVYWKGGSYNAFGIGNGRLLGRMEENSPVQIEDGWWAWMNDGVDPFILRRELQGIPALLVTDLEHLSWTVPVVLNIEGKRNFHVRYGAGWRPALTPEQTNLLEVCALAREELPLFLAGDMDTREEMSPRLCEWCATILAYINHISVEVLRELRLIDTRLLVSTLAVASNCLVDVDAEVSDAARG